MINEAIKKTLSTLYPTLPPEPDWDKKHTEGGNKMAPKPDIIPDNLPTKSLLKYCEIPARGNPIEISGKQVGLYKEVLKSLDYCTERERFTIDTRGESPELREDLGRHYLDNRVILVSEAQLRKPSMLDGNQSYVHKVVEQIQNTALELVKKITPHEALTGKINLVYDATSLIGIFDEDFKGTASTGGMHAVLSLDTLAESVKRINFLNNKIGFITESSLKNLDKELLNNILAEIHPLTTKYGSIESIKNLNVIDVPLQENEILYFNHKSRDVFFFNKYTPSIFLVYNGNTIEQKLPFEHLQASEKSKIMDSLVKNKFLKVEKENIFKNLEAMAKTFLKEEVKDCSDLTGFHFYKIFKKFKDHPAIAGKLKETDWYLLRDACYGNIEFSSLPLGLKEMITSPANEAVDSYLKLLEEKSSKG
ncbi:hypothetical protein FJZ53_01575 [Candidatus Woesearchaeota archaeon]|nr:hypothetical protein [Candidatus Woesearchaeota archaeon]